MLSLIENIRGDLHNEWFLYFSSLSSLLAYNMVSVALLLTSSRSCFAPPTGPAAFGLFYILSSMCLAIKKNYGTVLYFLFYVTVPSTNFIFDDTITWPLHFWWPTILIFCPALYNYLIYRASKGGQIAVCLSIYPSEDLSTVVGQALSKLVSKLPMGSFCVILWFEKLFHPKQLDSQTVTKKILPVKRIFFLTWNFVMRQILHASHKIRLLRRILLLSHEFYSCDRNSILLY